MATAAKLSPEKLKELIMRAEAELNAPTEMTAPKRRGRPKGSKNKPKEQSDDVATLLLHRLPKELLAKLTFDDLSTISRLVALDKTREPMHIASDDTK